MEIQEILLNKLPLELVNNILYKNNGLIHPVAQILKKIINECKEYIYYDSGGWEDFITFLTYYDSTSKGTRIKTITLEYYIYGLDKW